jgi:hypothetical protein
MRLSYRETQGILIGLRRIDAVDEAKLDPEVRLRIGININRLTPTVQVFEKEVQRIQQSVAPNGKNGVDAAHILEAEKALADLADSQEDYKLKKFKLDELRLKDNPKIKGGILAQIAPLIKDFDDGTFDDD